MLFPKQLKDNEYVCLFFMKTDDKGNVALRKDGSEIVFHKYVKSFEQYEEYVKNYRHQFHVYNALATVKIDKEGKLHRREANMYRRQVLFIDFDKKDFPTYKNAYDFTAMIKDVFPDSFLHACYDSGHGYHYYVIITSDTQNRKICDINKQMCKLVGADTDACKVTQIARVPCTFNRKSVNGTEKFPMVKEVNHFRKNEFSSKRFHPCNLDYIKRRIDNIKKKEQLELEQKPFQPWDYAGDGFDLKYYPCLCTEKILREGADKGQRNLWLGRIISMLNQQGNTETVIREKCLEWNTRCRPPKNQNEIRRDVSNYLDKVDVYKLNGCWENIEDERVRNAVKEQCDKQHCMQAVQKKPIGIQEDIGVKMSQKLLTKGRLKNTGNLSISGNEYLIMTILYKYIKPRKSFTIKDLKFKMQYKCHGKWKLCMDVKTFKKTIDSLVEHHCIEIIVPTPEQCKKKKVTQDDYRIKIKRGMKELNDKYIEFYYSTARAMIAKQITQNDYKVFLCIVNNITNGKSCTMEDLDDILHIGRQHVVEAISNLRKAQCIDVIQLYSDTGKWYNRYSLKHTDIHDKDTCNDEIVVDLPNSFENNCDTKEYDLTLKLLA